MKKRIIALVAMAVLMISMIPVAQAACNHKYDNGVVLVWGSCTFPKVVRYTCKKCGATKTSTINPSHSFSTKINYQAGYTHTGKKTLTCTKCGLTKTETIPKKSIASASSDERRTAENYFGNDNMGYGYGANTTDNVKKVQQKLKDLGYNVTVDGSFGTQTRDAVIKLEKDLGLPNDNGIVGPDIMLVLYYK